MLDAVIRWSVVHRGAVVLGWLAVVAAGLASVGHMRFDAFPDTTPVQVQVNATAPALAAEEIERRVALPVEQAISGLPGLAEVRSITRFGFTQVTATFDDGTDLYLARQVVAERVAGLELPVAPALGPVATGLGEVLHYLVRGEGASLGELRRAQDLILAPQLRAVPGVAEVNSWGGDERRIEVLVDPVRLAGAGIGLREVIARVERGQGSAGGGSLDAAGRSLLVQGLGLITTPEDVGRIALVSRGGAPLRVADVARVAEGREIRHGAVTEGARGEVVLGLGFMLSGENSRDVTRGLRARLLEASGSLPPGIEVEIVYDRTELVGQVLRTVWVNLAEGAGLVVGVLFVFLGSLRAGLLVAAAIPLCMLVAFALMLPAGIAGSLMSLGAIDFGLIVDSSVIIVENCIRRAAGSPPAGAAARAALVTDACLEVRRPTMFGELVIMIVYLPILALQGIEGKLFRPMALTVVFALLGSLLVSMTLVPALATLVLPRAGGARAHGDGLASRLAARAYRPLLRAALAHPWGVVALALLLLGNGAWLATRLGGEFVPRLSEGAVVVNTVRLAGVSLDESIRYGSRIERLLLDAFPDEVARVWTRTGSAEVATDPMGIELSDLFVTLTPRSRWVKARSQAELVVKMREALSGMPGTRMVFTQPIEMRTNEMIAGIRADLGVKLFGDDFELLKGKAREIEQLLRSIPGLGDVAVEQVTGQPVMEVVLDRDALGRHGVEVADALDAVAALAGVEVGAMRDASGPGPAAQVPVVVRWEGALREGPEALAGLMVSGEEGTLVPLERVARLQSVSGPAAINREWGRRRVVLQVNVAGRDVLSFVQDARAAIAAHVELPAGYFVRYGGQFEHLERARRRLLLVVPVALVLVFVLLYATYGRMLDALRVFTGVPFAAVGGVAALWLRGIPFSVSAAVGFVALAGVSVLGDIVLVSTIRQLRAEGRRYAEAIPEAAERRLRPVLMTALVAALGFVPMALSNGVGAEVQRPLATVVIGGIASSTALTLLVLPVLYALTVRGSERDGEP